MADLSNDEILDLVKKHESGGLNVTNYMYDPEHTAQGYYQITNTNWKNYGPKVGVDLQKYPTAMAAPEDVQRKVAGHLLTKTPKGAKNWESPAFRKAIGISDEEDAPAKDTKVPESVQDTRKAPDPNDLSGLSDDELAKQIAELKGEIQSKNQPRKDEIKTGPPSGAEKILGNVSKFVSEHGLPTPKWMTDATSSIREWAKTPTPAAQGILSAGIIPGLKSFYRADIGNESPKAQTSDFIEGMGYASMPRGIVGGARALMTGGPRALWPYVSGLGATMGLSKLGEAGSEAMGADPETQRLTGDIFGTAGAAIGPRFPYPGDFKVDLNSPRGDALTRLTLGYRGKALKDLISGGGPTDKVDSPKFPNSSTHEDIIANSTSGPERLQATREMTESLIKQGYTKEDAAKMSANAFRKAELADAEKAAAAQPKPEKPPKITYQQMDRNIAAVPAQSRMALKARYMEILTQQGYPPDVAEQHFNTAMVEAHQADMEAATKAAASEGPSAKRVEELKGMLANGTLPSEDYAQLMAKHLSPERIQQDIIEGRNKWLGLPQQKVNFPGQIVDPANLRAQPTGQPSGSVQLPQGGFNNPSMGAGSTGGELSNLTKFKPQFGPPGPDYGPPVKPPGYVPPPPPPEEIAEIPIASTKMVNNISKELVKGKYDLDKLPVDNLNWRQQIRDEAKLSGVPTQKSVNEAIGIARVIRAKIARGEKIPGVKIGRNAEGKFYRIEEP